MGKQLRVAAIQHDIVWNEPTANFAQLAPVIAGAAGHGARLILCTETFATGYVMDGSLRAEPFDGPSASFLAEQAAAHGVWVGGSCAERGPDNAGLPYNTFVLAGPGGAIHRYRKRHLFTRDGEDKSFQRGTELTTIDVEGLRCTPFVCYDLRFADDFWARTRETDCYLVVANWPVQRRLHWQTLLQARAIENQAYVVGVNRVGGGGGNHYPGDSRIVDPQGELLASGAIAATTLFADLDPGRVTHTRESYQFYQDRLPG